MDKKTESRLALAAVVMAMTDAWQSAAKITTGVVTPKMHKRVPTMVTASPEEIDAWNAKVQARNAAKPPHQKVPKNSGFRDSGQHPKLPKARAHRPASHPLRDGNGAYTLVGKARNKPVVTAFDPTGLPLTELEHTPRRKWLAGISAQRGY